MLPNNINTYQSHAEMWEKKATIRNRPRRMMEDDELSFYPINSQAICLHPHIINLGEKTLNYILLQSLYKYLNDVIIFEMDIVNKTAISIAGNSFPFEFPFECRQDAFTVIIDENYHAYAAMDYIKQVIDFTKIIPLKFSDKIELSMAIPDANKTLDPKYHAGMELIAVAIAENSVTAEVAKLSRDKTLKKSVKGLMSDHLIDEGRHSVFWTNIIKIYWNNITEKARTAIGAAIAVFMTRYLTFNCYIDFQHSLVSSLKLSKAKKQEVIESLDYSIPIDNHHPMMKPISLFLERSTILEHKPTYKQLKHLI